MGNCIGKERGGMVEKVEGIMVEYVRKDGLERSEMFVYDVDREWGDWRRNGIGGKGLGERVEKEMRKWFERMYGDIIVIECGMRVL